MSFADPANGIGYADVTRQMGPTITGDPRDVASRPFIRARVHGKVMGPCTSRPPRFGTSNGAPG